MPSGGVLALVTVLLGAGLVLGSYGIDRLLATLMPRRWYRLAITPGIIVHELSHAALCVLTGARIRRIGFFDPHGGAVEHERPRLGAMGNALIGVAPLFGVVVAFRWIASLAGLTLTDVSSVPSLGSSIGTFMTVGWDLLSGPWNTASHWLVVWLTLSLAASLAPSGTDLRHAIGGLVVFGLLAGMSVATGFGADPLRQGIEQWILPTISLGLILECLAFLVIAPWYALWRMRKRTQNAPPLR